MAATRRLKELISATLPKLDLPDGPVVVALSGGADSASLAFLAREAGHQPKAIHIDHQLPASALMSGAAREIADTLGVPLDIQRVVVGDGPSPEDQARVARYEALTRARGPILTGHTRDDSLETMLINLIRGTGPSGLLGIPRFRPPHIHRPMLEVTRSETREMATLAGLAFVDDPMNQDSSLTRTRVRLEVMPLLREINPRVEAALARTAATLGRDAEYLDRQTPRFDDSQAVPASVVLSLPRALADRVLHDVLERSGVDPTADRIERMRAVAQGQSDRQDLADGRVVVRRGAMLVIE